MVSFSPKYLETQYWPQTIVEIAADAHAIGWSSEEIRQLWKIHVLMAVSGVWTTSSTIWPGRRRSPCATAVVSPR